MTDYQHLGPEHPAVLSAVAAFDAWWDEYQPLAYLTETVLSEVPAGVDPGTVWTEFDGEYGQNIVPGFHSSGHDEVSGYWVTSRPWSEQDGDKAIVTEVRQYCENQDQAAREAVTCSDCPMAAGLCSGFGNQWCEIPNIRFPGGAPTYSVKELMEMLTKSAGDNPETMKDRGKLAYQNGDFATARHWWEQAAVAGNSDAMSNLGVLAQQDGDSARAQEWLEKAASAGNAVAMYNLGNIAHSEGELRRAEEWWQKAAGLGHSNAKKNLEALARHEQTSQETEGSGDNYQQLESKRVAVRDETSSILQDLAGDNQAENQKALFLEKWRDLAAGYEVLDVEDHDQSAKTSEKIDFELRRFLVSLEEETSDTKLAVLANICESKHFHRALGECAPPSAVAYTLISKGLYEWGMCATPDSFREEVEFLTDSLAEVGVPGGFERYRLMTLQKPSLDPEILEDEFQSNDGRDHDTIDAILANPVSSEGLLMKIFKGEFSARDEYDGFHVLSDLIAHPNVPRAVLEEIKNGEFSWEGLEDEEVRRELGRVAQARLVKVFKRP